jgi:hypothetical protein
VALEILEHWADQIGSIRRDGTLDQSLDAFTDERTIRVAPKRREIVRRQRTVHRFGDVAQRIGQRAIEIKDHGSKTHITSAVVRPRR